MTLADKTGAPVTVTKQDREFTISVDGAAAGETPVGLTAFRERNGQRIFHHTEVDEQFGGRGLATILVREALSATRADGLRIVAVCPMVAAYVKKHHDFDDIVDRPTREILHWLQGR
ncbi:MAG: GNAT family N-acetyltransferase [Mycobacterium sp.]